MTDTTQRTRAQLKAQFVKDAIPTTESFVELIDSSLNLVDDGVTVTPEAITITRPLEVKSTLTVTGELRAGGLFTAERGLTVSGGATEVGELRASGLFTAESGLTVSGGTVEVGTTEVDQSLTVHGKLEASTLTLGALSVTKIVNTMTSDADDATALPTCRAVLDHLGQLNGGLTASGPVIANGGLTVPRGKTLSADVITPSSTAANADLHIQLDLSLPGRGEIRLLQPAWEHYPGELLYSLKDSHGIVHLRGKVDGLGVATADGAYRIFTLPPDHTPDQEACFPALAGASYETVTHVHITAEGWGVVASAARPVYLDGVSFESNEVRGTP